MSAHRRGVGAGRGRFEARPHEYGPHREDDAPRLVTIWKTKVAKDGTHEVPIPEALIKQRRMLNTIAHEQARARAESPGA